MPAIILNREENNLLQVILVRHGETDWNMSWRIQGGNSDTQLNEAGEEQAEGLALRLKQERIKAIYSSPLKRALDTALVIASYHQLEVQIELALKELNVGELEGVPVSLVGKRLDELLTTPARDEIQVGAGENVWTKLQHIGGEPLEELQQRAWGTIQRIVNRHSDGVIVVVSHYFVLLTIICAVLNLPLSQLGRLRLGAGSISTVVFDEPVPRLILFGDSCHLIKP